MGPSALLFLLVSGCSAASRLEDAVFLIQSVETKPRPDGKKLDLLSGKFLTPEELEDVTHARMQNWVRPGFWIDRFKDLFKKKGAKKNSAEDEATSQDEADMQRVAEALGQLSKLEHPNATTADTASENARKQDVQDFKNLAEALEQLAKVEKSKAPAELAANESAANASVANASSANASVVSLKEVSRQLDQANQDEAKQDEADIAAMLSQLAKLEPKPAEEAEAAKEEGGGKKVLDLVSGKRMSPAELEDATEARMKNWVRPGFWLDRVKYLMERKGDGKPPKDKESTQM